MGRSYLYPGRDTKQLSPAEMQLERLYDQIDRPGYRITPQQFFQTPQASQLLDQLYGGLSDRVPPGSQIVSDTPGKLTYRDPEGYEHNIIRKPDGQFSETTNRPSVVPNAAQQSQQQFGQQIQDQLAKSLGQVNLAQLDPETAAQLQAISQAEQARNAQTGQDLEGQLVARLYGNNVNQSSIANEAAARFAQYQGLVNQQQQADAANRELTLRQYLTGAGLQQNQNLAGLYSTLTGQQSQRDIAGAGLDLNRQQLDEASRQFGATNYLQQLQTEYARRQADAQNGFLNKLLSGVSAAGALAGGAGTLLGAIKR